MGEDYIHFSMFTVHDFMQHHITRFVEFLIEASTDGPKVPEGSQQPNIQANLSRTLRYFGYRNLQFCYIQKIKFDLCMHVRLIISSVKILSIYVIKHLNHLRYFNNLWPQKHFSYLL